MFTQKTELNTTDINDWLDNHWNLYASRMYNKKLLRLSVNGNRIFRVTFGRAILYKGSQMTHAIAAWDAA